MIGRDSGDRRKQKVYLHMEPAVKGKREAITEFRVLKKFLDSEGKKYTLLEVKIKTGRKHQIRCHMAYLGHPIVCDKLYGFKNRAIVGNLDRQFLHEGFIGLKLENGQQKEFKADLPRDLKEALFSLNEITN